MPPIRHILFPRKKELLPLVEALHGSAFVDLSESRRPVSGPNRRPWAWALDLSLPLLGDGLLQPTALAITEILDLVGARQVAARGLGAAPLLGAVLAGSPGLRGILLRDETRERGLRRSHAGRLDRTIPVWLIDDVLHSGRSALDLADRITDLGGHTGGLVCIFLYEWGSGNRLLLERGLDVHHLAKVRRR